MKNIFIIGSRGYHYNYGGWETFVSNLVDNYNDKDTKFYISMYTNDKSLKEYKVNDNIIVSPIYVKNSTSGKMFFYSIKAFKYYLKYIKNNNINNANMLILGLKLFYYLKLYKRKLKKLNIKTIINPDGMEWMRNKWSYPVKKFFLISERLMLNNCDLIICDGLGIKKYVDNKYPKLKNITKYIAYGYNNIDLSKTNEEKILNKYHLKKNNYLLMVGRCVPENNYKLVINDFMKSNVNKNLIIITNLSNSKYYQKLVKETDCSKDKRIIFIDGIYNEIELSCIRKNAYLYIHGHSVGGTNPSLIEALSLTDLNILYDVCFNHDIGLNTCLYFKEQGSLTILLNDQKLLEESKKKLAKKAHERVRNNFTWNIIVDKYKSIFK